MNEPIYPESAARRSGSLVGWTHAIYALHAFSLLTGIFGAATVIGAFLIGWPSIIAVILNYVSAVMCGVRGWNRTSGGKFAHSGSACFGCRSVFCSSSLHWGSGLLSHGCR